MPMPDSIQTIADIDWPELRRRAMAKKSRRKKNVKEWDHKAKSFAERAQHTSYISLVMEQIPITAESSVLDIGCGPGTLALPLAKKARRVTALDYSKEMLTILQETAEKEELYNITTTCLAWEDDWVKAGIMPHDITLASRSTALEDLRMALTKLNSFAQKAVFLTDRVNAAPFEPEAFAAVGLDFNPGPDYIYTINTLHQMGICANVHILAFDRTRNYCDIEQAMEDFLWMFDELSDKQTTQLRDYLYSISKEEKDGSLTVTRANPPHWALISWEK